MREPFNLFMAQLNDGHTNAKVTAELDKLFAAVQATGKTGSVTLTIAVRLAARDQSDRVLITPKVSSKMPEPDPRVDFFWMSDDAEISRKHPTQGEIDLREVPAPEPRPLKDVAK